MECEGKKDFKHDSQLHITFEQLKRRKGSIQCFAIYVPETVAYEKDLKWHYKW